MRLFCAWVFSLFVTCGYCLSAEDQLLIDNVQRLDLNNMILPLLLSPDQAKDILAGVEKCDDALQARLNQYVKDLKVYKSQIDDALKGASDQGKVPSRDLLSGVYTAATQFTLDREKILVENAQSLANVIQSKLDSGQQRALINAIAGTLSVPADQMQAMDDTAKMHYFIKTILFNPLAKEILAGQAAKKS